MTDEGGAIETTKFSKFLTGFAVLFKQRVALVPSWMSDPEIVKALQPKKDLASRLFGIGIAETPVIPPKLFDRSDKRFRVPDPKAFLAVERTMLSWVRTIMIIFAASHYTLQEGNMLPSGSSANQVLGWIGFVVGWFMIGYAYFQYRRRNVFLVTSEDSLEFIDPLGVTALCFSLFLMGAIGAIVYQRPIF